MTENETERRTVEVTREQITVRTNLDVENYPALPIFVERGWVDATVEKERPEDTTYRVEDDETGAVLRFTPTWDRTDHLAKGNPNHIQKTGETGDSGNGDTYKIGDFYVDFRYKNGTWTGMDWNNSLPQLRVRFAEHIADPNPKIVVEGFDEEGGA